MNKLFNELKAILSEFDYVVNENIDNDKGDNYDIVHRHGVIDGGERNGAIRMTSSGTLNWLSISDNFGGLFRYRISGGCEYAGLTGHILMTMKLRHLSVQDALREALRRFKQITVVRLMLGDTPFSMIHDSHTPKSDMQLIIGPSSGNIVVNALTPRIGAALSPHMDVVRHDISYLNGLLSLDTCRKRVGEDKYEYTGVWVIGDLGTFTVHGEAMSCEFERNGELLGALETSMVYGVKKNPELRVVALMNFIKQMYDIHYTGAKNDSSRTTN